MNSYISISFIALLGIGKIYAGGGTEAETTGILSGVAAAGLTYEATQSHDVYQAVSLSIAAGAAVATSVSLLIADKQLTDNSISPTLNSIQAALKQDLDNKIAAAKNLSSKIPIDATAPPAGAAATNSKNSPVTGKGVSSGAVASPGSAGTPGFISAYNSLNESIKNKDYASMAQNPIFKDSIRNAAEKVAKKNGTSANDLFNEILNEFSKKGNTNTSDEEAKKAQQGAGDVSKQSIAMSQTHEIQGRYTDIFAIVHNRYANRYFAGLFKEIEGVFGK